MTAKIQLHWANPGADFTGYFVPGTERTVWLQYASGSRLRVVGKWPSFHWRDLRPLDGVEPFTPWVSLWVEERPLAAINTRERMEPGHSLTIHELYYEFEATQYRVSEGFYDWVQQWIESES